MIPGDLTITKEIEFDAGHRVPTHGGKCRSPHGHRYRVQIECAGDIVGDDGGVEAGMLTDFGFLKDLLTVHVHDVLDHAMIVWELDRPLLDAMDIGGMSDMTGPWQVVKFPMIPTAENIARWIAFTLDNKIAARTESLRLTRVQVWETPTSTASWKAEQ